MYMRADLKERKKTQSASVRVCECVYTCVCGGVREKGRKGSKNVQFRTFDYFLHLRSLVRSKFLIVSIASDSRVYHVERNG